MNPIFLGWSFVFIIVYAILFSYTMNAAEGFVAEYKNISDKDPWSWVFALVCGYTLFPYFLYLHYTLEHNLVVPTPLALLVGALWVMLSYAGTLLSVRIIIRYYYPSVIFKNKHTALITHLGEGRQNLNKFGKWVGWMM